jgi:hypothetical protein
MYCRGRQVFLNVLLNDRVSYEYYIISTVIYVLFSALVSSLLLLNKLETHVFTLAIF